MSYLWKKNLKRARGAARSISNLKVSVPVDFHIKLANAFEGKFECFGENTKKAKLFPVR